jgi:hypothetical protein
VSQSNRNSGDKIADDLEPEVDKPDKRDTATS